MNKQVLTWLKQKDLHLGLPLWILSILQLIMSLTALFFAFFSRETIDSAVDANAQDRFIMFAIIMSSLLVLQLLTSTLTPYIRVAFTVRLENRMKQKLFERLLYAKLKMSSSYHSGDLVNHLTSDIHLIADGMTDLLPKFIFYTVRFLGAFIFLAFIDLMLALVLIGLGFLLFIGSRILANPIKRRHKHLQEAESRVRSMMQESLSHVPVIKSFQAEHEISHRLGSLQDEQEHATLKKQQLTLLSSFGMTGFLVIGYGLAIILGAIRLSEGILTIGGLTALIQLVGHLQSPFGGLSQLVPKYYQTISSIERIMVLDQLEQDDPSSSPLYSFESLEAKKVSFAYEKDDIIKSLTFTIKKQTTLQIVGESGKGKTTLIKLLLGLYEPSSGSLLIQTEQGAIAISSSTRSYFSYVPQGNMMMSGTLRDNLQLYQKATDEELWNALEIACLKDDIEKLPNHLDTQLGERGLGLSEGQVQRLAVARALLKQSPIILLDEMTSALDSKTESLVLSNIKKMTDKTIIIISHRMLPETYLDQSIELI